jgi:hypothetical protein
VAGVDLDAAQFVDDVGVFDEAGVGGEAGRGEHCGELLGARGHASAGSGVDLLGVGDGGLAGVGGLRGGEHGPGPAAA